MKFFSGEQVDMGVAHGDDLQYIFSDIWGDDLSMSPTDTKFSRNIFAPLLTNFAKTSVPTPTITGNLCYCILSLYVKNASSSTKFEFLLFLPARLG